MLSVESCIDILSTVVSSSSDTLPSTDVRNILNVRTGIQGAELDSFPKAAEAMIDTLYAKHQGIPPEIWRTFFNTRRVILTCNRDSFASILQTVRNLPRRVQVLALRESSCDKLNRHRITSEQSSQLAAAVVASQTARPAGPDSGSGLLDVDLSVASITSDDADELLGALKLLQKVKLRVQVAPDHRWSPSPRPTLKTFDMSLERGAASTAPGAPLAGPQPALDLALLCDAAQSLESISINSSDVSVLNAQRLAKLKGLKSLTCSSAWLHADAWQLLQALPELEHASLGNMAISITPDSCVLQHLTQLEANITSVAVPAGMAEQGSLAKLLPGLQHLELDDLLADVLEALHGSGVQHLKCVISGEEDVDVQELPEALAELRSIECTLNMNDAETALLSAAAGCENLQELRVDQGETSELWFTFEAFERLASGRCRGLRSVVLVGYDVSLSGLMLLARKELPKLRCVDLTAHMLYMRDYRWWPLEHMASKQWEMQQEAEQQDGLWDQGKRPMAVYDEFVTAVDSYVASNHLLAAFLQAQEPEQRWLAERETEAQCPGYVMSWMHLGLDRQLGLIAAGHMTHKQVVAVVDAMPNERCSFSRALGECRVSLQLTGGGCY